MQYLMCVQQPSPETLTHGAHHLVLFSHGRAQGRVITAPRAHLLLKRCQVPANTLFTAAGCKIPLFLPGRHGV